MKFPSSLKRVKLLKRYKRFLADIYHKESDLYFTAHCANSGSMKGIFTQEQPMAWVSPAANKARKLPYTLEIVETDYGMVGVNTQFTNAIALEAILEGKIDALVGYERHRREVKYGENSRIDILLEDEQKPPAYVEVKNVSMREDGVAMFPDAVTSRGTKHLLELIHQVHLGNRAVMLYIAQRSDLKVFKPAVHIDPLYAETLEKAVQEGVEVLAYNCRVSEQEIVVNEKMIYQP